MFFDKKSVKAGGTVTDQYLTEVSRAIIEDMLGIPRVYFTRVKIQYERKGVSWREVTLNLSFVVLGGVLPTRRYIGASSQTKLVFDSDTDVPPLTATIRVRILGKDGEHPSISNYSGEISGVALAGGPDRYLEGYHGRWCMESRISTTHGVGFHTQNDMPRAVKRMVNVLWVQCYEAHKIDVNN